MAKEEIKISLPGDQTVSKGLSFTKKDFEELVESSMNLIKQAKKNRWPKEDVVSLYGIFYSSMAGLIRSGALVSRDTGIDGFPELHIIAKDKEYRCRESVIYGVLGNEADDLLAPYEDTFASYVANRPFDKQIKSAPTEIQEADIAAAEPPLEAKKKGSRKEAAKSPEKAAENFAQQKKQMEAAHQKEILELKDELKKSQDRVRYFETQAKGKKGQVPSDEVTAQLAKANETISGLTKQIEEKEAECAKLTEAFRTVSDDLDQEREKEKEASAKHADEIREISERYEEMKQKAETPLLSEKSIYNELLPDLIHSIDTSKTDTAIRAVLMVLSLAGIFVSFLFLV
ncbi:MAG: hypothetical protein LUE86_05780 [Clostridiales bacterium]|nr:hypothetical protein [Clostridiales bacterium]